MKAYDKYQKQHIIIEFLDDDMFMNESFSSNYASATVMIGVTYAEEDKGREDPNIPKRWSDLTNLEII